MAGLEQAIALVNELIEKGDSRPAAIRSVERSLKLSPRDKSLLLSAVLGVGVD